MCLPRPGKLVEGEHPSLPPSAAIVSVVPCFCESSPPRRITLTSRVPPAALAPLRWERQKREDVRKRARRVMLGMLDALIRILSVSLLDYKELKRLRLVDDNLSRLWCFIYQIDYSPPICPRGQSPSIHLVLFQSSPLLLKPHLTIERISYEGHA